MPDHTPSRGAYTKGCRCHGCRTLHNNYQREYRLRRAETGPPPGVHGTNAGYQQWECRCVACRLAAKAWRLGRKMDTQCIQPVS